MCSSRSVEQSAQAHRGYDNTDRKLRNRHTTLSHSLFSIHISTNAEQNQQNEEFEDDRQEEKEID